MENLLNVFRRGVWSDKRLVVSCNLVSGGKRFAQQTGSSLSECTHFIDWFFPFVAALSLCTSIKLRLVRRSRGRPGRPRSPSASPPPPPPTSESSKRVRLTPWPPLLWCYVGDEPSISVMFMYWPLKESAARPGWFIKKELFVCLPWKSCYRFS